MKIIIKPILAFAAILIFILGLEILKSGAGGVMPVLRGLHVSGVLNAVGLGWLMAYCVLSGSPVAAVALSLFGSGDFTDVETLGMIAGSRFGASFVVLLVGAIYYFRKGGNIITVATGVLCMLVTCSIYIPATVLGYVLLRNHALDGASLATPSLITGIVELMYQPILRFLVDHLHRALVFLLGLGTLVASFAILDRALPDLDAEHSRFRQISFVIYRADVMFLLGMAVTCLTLSVSVSLGLLIPLSAKGYVRRENIIPYIMGANISTFMDTLVVALLVGEPRALTVVLAQMIGVTIVSVVVLLGSYRSYRDGLEWALEWVTQDRRSFLFFVGIIMLIPGLLMLI